MFEIKPELDGYAASVRNIRKEGDLIFFEVGSE